MSLKTEGLFFGTEVLSSNYIGHNLGSLRSILMYYTILKRVSNALSVSITIMEVHRKLFFSDVEL